MGGTLFLGTLFLRWWHVVSSLFPARFMTVSCRSARVQCERPVGCLQGLRHGATGNWKTFKQDNDGNGTWELNQTRTANKANEITGITNSVGAAWATPTEALEIWRAGDVNPLMFQFESRKIRVLTYPARLSICLHPHDSTYTSGTLTETRHHYCTPGWQCVEERVGTSTTLERQFMSGLRYIARTVSFES